MTLLSTGIDIGTTTTQLTISKLALVNKMPGSQIPKIEIEDKTVIYRSQSRITPLIDRKTIDVAALRDLLAEEYRAAGIDASQIHTGAVIITGETAKKENAEAIVHLISEIAGDFVVAVAGPDVESVLAGKGSGAMAFSKKRSRRIINLDIGGGTTNIAVFSDGKLESTACLSVGGRVVEVDHHTGKPIHITEIARLISENKGIDLTQGKAAYSQLCRAMVRAVDACVFMEPFQEGDEKLLVTSSLAGRTLNGQGDRRLQLYEGVMFSGGVGRCIYTNQADESDYRFGDLGPVLAEAFSQSRLLRECQLAFPAETIQATVIGAGSFALEVSGSTVFINENLLPVKNVPVGRVELTCGMTGTCDIEESIAAAMTRYGGAVGSGARGISLSLNGYPSFGLVTQIASAIVKAWESCDAVRAPLIIVTERDIGKVLGQTVYALTKGAGVFASIDAVAVQDGDYIDIGRPMLGGDAVPVVVKTLIFQSGG